MSRRDEEGGCIPAASTIPRLGARALVRKRGRHVIDPLTAKRQGNTRTFGELFYLAPRPSTVHDHYALTAS
jgi:hypothetical protein